MATHNFRLRQRPPPSMITKKCLSTLKHLSSPNTSCILLPIALVITRRTHTLHSSSASPTPNNHRNDLGEISDQEWDIRTGRAIYVLQQTLPNFFQTGLVSNVDATRGPDLGYSISSDHGDVENIYSPKIRLMYTPPVALPSPFPRTLSIEGLPLYMASSVFIRHTMKTLYSDLRVDLRKLVVQTPPPHSPNTPNPQSEAVESAHRTREKSLFLGFTVLGTARVSGGLGEWQVDSTYSFSPVTGLINMHVINSIQPAPHQAAYDALRTSLSSAFGLGGGGVGGIQPGEARAVEPTKTGM